MSDPRQPPPGLIGALHAHGRRLVLLREGAVLALYVEVDGDRRDSARLVSRVSRCEATALVQLLQQGLAALATTTTTRTRA